MPTGLHTVQGGASTLFRHPWRYPERVQSGDESRTVSSDVPSPAVAEKRRTVADVLRADAFRYTGRAHWRAQWQTFLRVPGYRYTWFLRWVAALAPRRRTLGLFPYLICRYFLHRYRFRYGFDISPTTRIGPGLYLGHFGGVVVSPEAILGANVNVGHGVTIGATSRGEGKGAPTIQDRVWIGAHAIVVGRITVGHDAMIAPGAFVNHDVPPYSLVLGNPGKVVAATGSAGYVNHLPPDAA